MRNVDHCKGNAKFQLIMFSKDSWRFGTRKMVLLSLSLKRIDPFTVQAEITPSCCLMADSLVKVALVKSSKKGNRMRVALVPLVLVEEEGALLAVLGSLGENSFRLQNTKLLQ